MAMEKDGLTLERGDRLKFVDREKDRTIEGLFIGSGVSGDLIVVPLSDHQQPVLAGAILHGRLKCRNDMVAFTSRILEVIDHPVTLWRIQVPTDVYTFDSRDNRRVQCSVSATVELIDRGQMLAGIIRDISKSGARCIFPSAEAGDSRIEVGDTVILCCVFPGMPGEQAARGKIAEVSISEDEWSMAVRFEESAWWVPPYH